MDTLRDLRLDLRHSVPVAFIHAILTAFPALDSLHIWCVAGVDAASETGLAQLPLQSAKGFIATYVTQTNPTTALVSTRSRHDSTEPRYAPCCRSCTSKTCNSVLARLCKQPYI